MIIISPSYEAISSVKKVTGMVHGNVSQLQPPRIEISRAPHKPRGLTRVRVCTCASATFAFTSAKTTCPLDAPAASGAKGSI